MIWIVTNIERKTSRITEYKAMIVASARCHWALRQTERTPWPAAGRPLPILSRRQGGQASAEHTAKCGSRPTSRRTVQAARASWDSGPRGGGTRNARPLVLIPRLRRVGVPPGSGPSAPGVFGDGKPDRHGTAACQGEPAVPPGPALRLPVAGRVAAPEADAGCSVGGDVIRP